MLNCFKQAGMKWEFSISLCPEAALGSGDEDAGDGDALQEEDEGKDSGGDYDEKEPEGEPNESQPASDSAQGEPDFAADDDDDDVNKPFEKETKPEPEEPVKSTQGDFLVLKSL